MPVRHARLTLGADPACATLPQLQARLRARDWQLAAEATAQVELSLFASVRPQSGNALQVALRVDWPDGRSAERSLTATHCTAALDALALLINMTLDTSKTPPAAARSPVPARTAAALRGRGKVAAQATLNEREPVPPAAPSEVAPAPEAPAAVGVTAAVPAPPEDVPNADDSADLDWLSVAYAAVGARVVLGNGTAPRLQPGLGLYAALALRGVGLLRPLLQLELSHAWLRGVAAQGGRADFTWDGGQLSLCPLGVRWAGLAGYTCAALEAGRLAARGYDTYQPRAQPRPWLGAGAALLLTAALWQRFELQLGVTLIHPLWRDQFVFAPEVFYAVPALRFQLQLGIAMRFP